MNKLSGIILISIFVFALIPASGCALELVDGPTIYPLEQIYPATQMTASATLYFPPKSFSIDDGVYLHTDIDCAEWLVEVWGEKHMYTSYEYYGNHVGIRGWSLYYPEKIWLKIMVRGTAPQYPGTGFSPLDIEEVSLNKNQEQKKYQSGILTVQPTPTPIPTFTPTPTPVITPSATAVPMPSPETIEEDEGASLSQMFIVGAAGMGIGLVLLIFILVIIMQPKRRTR